MQMRSGHSPCRSYEPNPLSPPHCVAHRHERFAEVKIRRDDSATVVDINHVAGEKEIVDECNNSAVRGEHRLSDRATEIDAKVTAGDPAVEDAAGTEFAGDHRCPRSKE